MKTYGTKGGKYTITCTSRSTVARRAKAARSAERMRVRACLRGLAVAANLRGQ